MISFIDFLSYEYSMIRELIDDAVKQEREELEVIKNAKKGN